MSGQILTAISALQVIALALAAALTVVVPAYLVLWSRIKAAARDINGVGRKVNDHAAVLAGAGGLALRSAPRWNQLADPLSDGTLAPQRFNECGEECAAMEIARQHGVPLSADALRFLLGGAARAPITSAADLVRVMALCNVPAVSRDVAASAIAGELQACTAAGGVAIVLGNWVDPHVLHWILVTRADGAGCSANDPWGGRRRSWTWEAFRPLYAGEFVRSTRVPDPA